MDTTKSVDVKFDLSLPGVITTMSGFWTETDIATWSNSFLECCNQNCSNTPFKVLVDMRGFKSPSPQIKEQVEAIQNSAKKMHLLYSAVVTDTILSEIQMKSVAKHTGVAETEGYFSNYTEAYTWLKSK